LLKAMLARTPSCSQSALIGFLLSGQRLLRRLRLARRRAAIDPGSVTAH
jgi:hypothetical protein